jgi:hypothetical protein
MRRPLIAALVLAFACSTVPLHAAFAQNSKEDPEQEAKDKKKKEEEWGDKQAPLPQLRNAGPCPYVKVLYDAGRYIELKDNKETISAVGYTGEIQGLSSGCAYKAADPIKVQVEVLFALGKGAQAPSSQHTYRYWVAVTDRNNEVINKVYFNLPVTFPSGQDRTLVTDKIQGIMIPRAAPTVSGGNFEVLIGFDVTPDMVAFNRLGKRFRPNAGVAQADAGQPGQSASQ